MRPADWRLQQCVRFTGMHLYHRNQNAAPQSECGTYTRNSGTTYIYHLADFESEYMPPPERSCRVAAATSPATSPWVSTPPSTPPSPGPLPSCSATACLPPPTLLAPDPARRPPTLPAPDPRRYRNRERRPGALVPACSAPTLPKQPRRPVVPAPVTPRTPAKGSTRLLRVLHMCFRPRSPQPMQRRLSFRRAHLPRSDSDPDA